jgi:hypothetical protein
MKGFVEFFDEIIIFFGLNITGIWSFIFLCLFFVLATILIKIMINGKMKIHNLYIRIFEYFVLSCNLWIKSQNCNEFTIH